MDDNAKKTALRMIPYGLYVLTTEHGLANRPFDEAGWKDIKTMAIARCIYGVRTNT